MSKLKGEPIAILNHNTPTAYLVPAGTYEELIDQLEDHQLGLLVREVVDREVYVLAIAVGKRDKDSVYKKASGRSS